MGAEVVLVGPPTFHVAIKAVWLLSDLAWSLVMLTRRVHARVQLERMEGAPIRFAVSTTGFGALTGATSKLMKPEAIICHPGPQTSGMEPQTKVTLRSLCILDQVNAERLTFMRNVFASGDSDGISA